MKKLFLIAILFVSFTVSGQTLTKMQETLNSKQNNCQIKSGEGQPSSSPSFISQQNSIPKIESIPVNSTFNNVSHTVVNTNIQGFRTVEINRVTTPTLNSKQEQITIIKR
jgi:hypothetical protein